MDYITTLSIKSHYEGGDSMLLEDNIRSSEFIALQIPETSVFILNALPKNLEISDPVANNSLANSSISWSNMFETMI